ncbi:hypothetical protein EDC18_105130 [Natranaerovirga pectinivora]|uniref:Radical SAM core domain-containing protein n=1 Tax=Natranaerovirga pectinivora TaxID=682400 RepID=A0A4R3MJQ6_9FIRM|nr:TIGR01212 family radical SAM protein [Natranaerovirga pectinivora]TCT14649.1 hypothetical protein EDC18_105130 [Natranaerovirga pectinivora]
MNWDSKPYYSLSTYYKALYHDKVYKISLNGGFTCPNRDGTIDSRGCIFCSEGGSGDFASSDYLSITDQIEEGKKRLANKKIGKGFIAYFQAFTNTYGSIDKLRNIYFEAIHHPDIVGISIATRPDCLSDDVLDLLSELNTIKKVWLELGLQTIHNETAKVIRRGYSLHCFDEAVKKLYALNLDIVVHLIIGLPNESREDILESIKYIAHLPISGVKLQLLHVLKYTDLAKLYYDEQLKVLEKDEYIDLIIDCIEHLPPDMVIHRITGDGPKSILIAPFWSGNKKDVLNSILKRFKERNTYQGKLFNDLD